LSRDTPQPAVVPVIAVGNFIVVVITIDAINDAVIVVISVPSVSDTVIVVVLVPTVVDAVVIEVRVVANAGRRRPHENAPFAEPAYLSASLWGRILTDYHAAGSRAR